MQVKWRSNSAGFPGSSRQALVEMCAERVFLKSMFYSWKSKGRRRNMTHFLKMRAERAFWKIRGFENLGFFRKYKPDMCFPRPTKGKLFTSAATPFYYIVAEPTFFYSRIPPCSVKKPAFSYIHAYPHPWPSFWFPRSYIRPGLGLLPWSSSGRRK